MRVSIFGPENINNPQNLITHLNSLHLQIDTLVLPKDTETTEIVLNWNKNRRLDVELYKEDPIEYPKNSKEIQEEMMLTSNIDTCIIFYNYSNETGNIINLCSRYKIPTLFLTID